MQTFRLDTKTVRVKKPNTAANVIVLAAIYFMVRLAVDLLCPAPEGKESLSRLMVTTSVWAVATALLTVLYAHIQMREYELRVDDRELRVKSKWFDRSVRRGEIRTLIERKDGLLISSRGRLGTFLWGGLLISRMLPEYEQLKRFAAGWKQRA